MQVPRLEGAILLAGPTGSGKSEVAMLLAERIGGEIVSVDSMQVYRGMDIGTAKPSEEERKRIRHHLVDVVDVREAFDAAQFVRLANEALPETARRGKTPILCGGTGLYFQALLGGLGSAPPPDAALRAELEGMPMEKLLEELAARDPALYEKIDRENRRRLVRAVEVVRLTGKPFSEQRASWPSEAAMQLVHAFCLERDILDLMERIHQRVERMFKKGLVLETEDLLRKGLEKNRTASQSLGYKQVIEHLRGKRSLGETISLVQTRTCQFAKRQRTWFRKYGKWNRIEVKWETTADQVAEEIMRERDG
jgi:tRNA dimethylallyltransferase